MNKEQTKYRSMFSTTQKTLDEYTGIWNQVPVNVKTKNDYDELLQRIDTVNEKTDPNSRAITESKDETRANLARKAVVISGILQAFAAYNDDKVLAAKTKLTKTDVQSAREADVEKLITPVINESRAHMSDLGEFMLIEEMIVEVETTLDNFKAQIGQPRFIRNQAFAAISKLDVLFNTTNDLLNNKMDNLMLRYAGSHPEFYEAYQRARTIVD